MENKWEMLSSSNEEREKIWTKNRTFAGDVWFRFRRKPTAIAGLTMIILLLLFALAGPMFTEYSYSVQDLEVVNIPPVMEVYDTPRRGRVFLHNPEPEGALRQPGQNPGGPAEEGPGGVRHEHDDLRLQGGGGGALLRAETLRDGGPGDQGDLPLGDGPQCLLPVWGRIPWAGIFSPA